MAPRKEHVLIVGASFAGLTTAFWLLRDGYKVTVVEITPAIREGGTPVNIKDNTVAIVERMGIFDQVAKNNIATVMKEVWTPTGRMPGPGPTEQQPGEADGLEFEVERGLLLRLMFELVAKQAKFIFNDSVVALQDQAEGVDVSFASGQVSSFDLIFGCDGIHSKVRQCCFGDEGQFAHFLNAYGSVTSLDKLLVEPSTAVMYQEPGKAVVLSAYNGKTDIITTFSAPKKLAFPLRDRAQAMKVLREQYAKSTWRLAELLTEIEAADNFYFTELAQIKMPSWTKGRVALVGDAGYCASPAAGRGGSLAIDGAVALTDALATCGRDYQEAFRQYNADFRPFLEQVQADAVNFCNYFLGRDGT